MVFLAHHDLFRHTNELGMYLLLRELRPNSLSAIPIPRKSWTLFL